MLHAAADLVVDRSRLPRVLSRAHHEVIGVGADGPHVQDDHVLRQLFLCETGDAACLFERRQCGFRSFLVAPKCSRGGGGLPLAVETERLDLVGHGRRDERVDRLAAGDVIANLP